MKLIEWRGRIELTPAEVREILIECVEKAHPGNKVRSVYFQVRDVYHDDEPGERPSPALVSIDLELEKK